MGRVLLAVSLAAAALALAQPVTATHGCSSGDRIIEQTREARVFTKGTFPRSREPRVYACSFRRGSSFRLNPAGEFGPTDVFRTALGGHFVAYARDLRCGACSGFFTQVRVKSLRTGRDLRVSSATASGDEGDGGVSALVVKRNGSAAWIATEFLGLVTERQVFRIDASGQRVLLDRGPGIAPGSLALSDDRTMLYWTHDGAPMTAPIG